MREPVVGATADGRWRGEPFAANLSPSLGVRVRGLISLLQSFAKIDYQSIFNGGPIMMELSNSVFRNAESIRKTAMLVRIFVQLGCHRRNDRHDGAYREIYPTGGDHPASYRWPAQSLEYCFAGYQSAATRAALLKCDLY